MVRKGFLATFLIGVVLALSACQSKAAAKPTVVVAVQPTQAVADMTAKAEELKQFLEKETGFNIKVFVPTSEAAVVEALKYGNADVALLGSLPAFAANIRAGGEVPLAEVREVAIDGTTTEATYYFSHFVVLKDSPYTRITDLKGKKVAFSGPLSTSGFLFPVAELVKQGLISKAASGEALTPDELKKKLEREFFQEAIFAGGYAQAWEALKRGQVDVAVIAGDVSRQLYDEVLAGTKTLTKQGPVPSHTVVVRKDLDASLKNKVQEAFLKLSEQRDMMRKFISAIFVRFEKTSTEEHLNGLKEAIQLTGYAIGQ
ncbi:MAG: phosphate/phosphite/phosphonate ABC transporter substrate-binding protein [Chloroflexi bacterium]|nr:phosphate/phosphite/phosphonate ABC transporter substrate-binding protein [Chloroflexota bacterium]